MRKRSPSTSRLEVLKAIRVHAPVSRSDLPRLTGLAAGTISQTTAELVARGYVVEARETEKRSGRPRTYLTIASEGPLVLGAVISTTNTLLITFVDLNGTIRSESELPFAGPGSIAELAERVAETIAQAIDASGFARERIEHVGIGVPALVDSVEGVVHFMATFEDTPYPFAAAVADRIGLPVTIEKGTTYKARAQHWHGAAQGHDTFTLVNVGLSLDSAAYSDGLPRVGVHGFGPELAHVRTGSPDDAEPCYCGSRGCATTYASIYSIVLRGFGTDAAQLDPRNEAQVEALFIELLDRACAGDSDARAVFDTAGAHLGQVLASYVKIADPGLILIAVPDMRFERVIQAAFSAALNHGILPPILKMTEIRFTLQEKNWHSLGTASLALEKS
jgi:predicted NBD/HSP70 family sugar kinase